MIIPEHKMIFIHIPKTAGMAICQALGVKPVKGREHHTAAFIKEVFYEYKNYFSFTVVRNPFDRLVSYYCYYQQLSPARKHYKDVTFKQFISKTGLQQFDQVSYITEKGRVIVDKILKYENLEAEFNQLLKDREIKAELEHVNKSYHLHYSTYYNYELKNIVSVKFKRDLEMFNYKF